MKDGLSSGEMRLIDLTAVGSVRADLISGATTAVGAGELGTDEIAASAVTSVKQAFVSTGSPPTGGYIVQMGAGTLSGGSTWIAYPKAFTASPKVITHETDQIVNYDVNVHVAPGSVTTGSFIAVGSDAETTFNWLAIGSGTF